ncbi:MAG: ASKHA domain-containing protein [Thermodesulfovibrionales bacterium]|nr:ASKHA domain-containing protein [Thermodesulfovibrionales bacterium]
MEPLIKLINVKLTNPTSSDKTADKERLLRELLKNLNKEKDLMINVPLSLLRKMPRYLRKNDFLAKAVIAQIGNSLKLIDLVEDYKIYALAIDIGTTNIVASLFEMNEYTPLCSTDIENPQLAIGNDVLTRVQFAMLGGLNEMHRELIRGLNDLINNIANLAGIDKLNIYAAVIAGNTIMTHFLLNLNVDNIPVEPYIPVSHSFELITASDIGLHINPEAIVYVYPNCGSYVGGDIVSGILYSGLYKQEKPTMLIDVGTNAEIVLGCKDWILVGAGAAGPALEGGISPIGMRAADGAIYSVEIDNNFNINYKTIGSERPKGICGSGMIELISEMYKKGIIDNQGRLQKVSDQIEDLNGERVFIIVNSDEDKLMISDNDIKNFLRSKAAMFSSIFIITRSVGIRFKDIDRIFMSGAFGKWINPDKAKRIGMIPHIDSSKFLPIGNSSLKGAELLLKNNNLLNDIEYICNIITYKEMNTDGDFMREFPAAIFIPHTNPQILND